MLEQEEGFKIQRKRLPLPITLIIVGLLILGIIYVHAQWRKMKELNASLARVRAMTYSSVDLPGMSLELPESAPFQGDYSQGIVKGSHPVEWFVLWQAGEPLSAEAQRSMVEYATNVVDSRYKVSSRIVDLHELSIAGAQSYQFGLVTQGDISALVTVTYCGGRVVTLMAIGFGDVKETGSKMATSFKCKPEPSQELSHELVALAVKPGWKRTLIAGKPTLVSDNGLLVRTAKLLALGGSAVEQVILAAQKSGEFSFESDRPKERDGYKVWYGTVGQKKAPVAIVAWPCPDGIHIGEVTVFGAEDTSLEKGVDLALTGRCLAPGEEPPVFPSENEPTPAAKNRKAR